jgi:hypothetical protein
MRLISSVVARSGEREYLAATAFHYIKDVQEYTMSRKQVVRRSNSAHTTCRRTTARRQPRRGYGHFRPVLASRSLSHCGAQRCGWPPTSCADDRRFDRWCGGALRAAAGATSAVLLRFAWHPAAPQCWTLHTFVRDFVAQEDVVGVVPPAGVDEPKRCGSLAHENRDSLP